MLCWEFYVNNLNIFKFKGKTKYNHYMIDHTEAFMYTNLKQTITAA